MLTCIFILFTYFSIVDDDWEEGDSVEADGEMQIVTECWVEPQNGVVTSLSPYALHLHNCNYRELAQAVSTSLIFHQLQITIFSGS